MTKTQELTRLVKKGMRDKDLIRIFRSDLTMEEWAFLLLNREKTIGPFTIDLLHRADQIEFFDVIEGKEERP